MSTFWTLTQSGSPRSANLMFQTLSVSIRASDEQGNMVSWPFTESITISIFSYHFRTVFFCDTYSPVIPAPLCPLSCNVVWECKFLWVVSGQGILTCVNGLASCQYTTFSTSFERKTFNAIYEDFPKFSIISIPVFNRQIKNAKMRLKYFWKPITNHDLLLFYN